MGRTIRIVDVFTEKPLAGNQLAVVLDGRDLRTEEMQRIAREMNFSETTFVLPAENRAHAAKVRIFTPFFEMKFAGHPTVGTAWVLADEGLVPDGSLEFVLEEGVGPVRVRGVRQNGRVKERFGSLAKRKRFAKEDRKGHRSEFRKPHGKHIRPRKPKKTR